MKEKETKNTIEQASLNFVSSASSLPIMYIVRIYFKPLLGCQELKRI